jgi:glycosyltransferase involved in cell wall biosynthesis
MSERKRSIVFINQATGYLTIDIINQFASSSHFSNVALIAGSIRVQDIPLNNRVTWSKISLYDRGNPRKKFLSWLGGTIQIFWLLLTKYRKYEVFYITIPPFAYLLSLIIRNPFSVLVFDVYPDVLQIYNISSQHVIHQLWAKCNRKLFRRAHRVFTLGQGMAKLLYQYADPAAITIIPNWSGLTQVTEITKESNSFLKQQGLVGKFIVQYSGNIGYTHNLEILVEVAGRLKTEPDIFFLIIGRGEKFNSISQMVNDAQLANCRLLPFQPDDLLNQTLSAADLGVVLLDDKTAHVSLPSKIYNMQAVGTPILAIADQESEIASHLKKYENGHCFSPHQVNDIVQYILWMKRNPDKMSELRINSRKASLDFTMDNARNYLLSYVQHVDEATV